MSSFITSRLTFRSATSSARAAITPRLSSTRCGMSTMHDNDPETLEIEKKRNLSNTQHKTSTPHKSAPGWNENLASTSEASVKADRSARDSSTEDLQAETVEYVRARYTPDDRMAPTTAYYSRDEVAGPLGSALGHEDQDVHRTVVKEVHEKTTEVFQGKPAKDV